MALRRQPRHARWGVRVVGVALLAAVAAVAYLYWLPNPPVAYHLTVTAGSGHGLRHRMAETLAAHAAGRDVRLRVVETAGSEAALDAVAARKVDVALVQGGLSFAARPDLRQVAPLHVEPLHLLVRPEHFAAVAADLGQLRGKSINISTPGSGTFTLALETLRLAGLEPGADRGRGDYVINTMGYDELLAAPPGARLPDAAFLVSSLPSPVGRQLVRRHGYRLVPLPFADALGVAATAEEAGAEPPAADVVKAHLHDATIPAMAYSVQPPVPDRDVRTIGARLLLVAHRDVPAAAVERLVGAVYETRFAHVGRPLLDAGLLATPPEAPPHAGATAYLARGKPLVARDVMDGLEWAATVGGACVGVALFAFARARDWRRRRRADKFDRYMDGVRGIRAALHKAVDAGGGHDRAALADLRDRLDVLKAEAFGEIVDGELAGHTLTEFFLDEVRQTRDEIAALIRATAAAAAAAAATAAPSAGGGAAPAPLQRRTA